MSDLQCPANVVLAACDMLPALAEERFSGVYVALASDAASCRQALQDLSDVYRGETILVIATREQIRDVLGRAADSAQPSLVAIDSSGWVVSRYSAKSPLASG